MCAEFRVTNCADTTVILDVTHIQHPFSLVPSRPTVPCIPIPSESRDAMAAAAIVFTLFGARGQRALTYTLAFTVHACYCTVITYRALIQNCFAGSDPCPVLRLHFFEHVFEAAHKLQRTCEKFSSSSGETIQAFKFTWVFLHGHCQTFQASAF